jgi:hypothetical protein
MYIIREILNCKPGKVRPLIEKFRVLSQAVQEIGLPPIRLLTDTSGAPFWTLIAEVTVGSVDEFFAIEPTLMAKESVQRAMTGYHDLVKTGRREIYRVES